ncbi:unnamed protein product [Rotaria magnacalcarata]|uniref:CCHC-type domain-containing protein n=4 Tax=Rotaria magnacalcarata TaxID=392030 RepID=A0A8S3GIE1_9BILA|nr:unnamed protein product [Rotaria magnacalcarata]
MNENEHVITNQARRFATTRYPFAPFIVHFKEDIRDKLVVEHLVKYAKEQCNNFDLRVLGYRRTQTNNTVDEYDVLVFVENTQSFAFLREVGNWPAQLVGKEYSRKMPSIPPQLSGVIQNVAFNVDWDEFVQDLKRQYPQIVNVIQLKNRNLKDLKLVKVKFNSDTIRNEFLEGKYVYVHFMRYPVVEYMALAQVLICSRCMHIGHFQKNCPQKDEVTCKICGAICTDLKKHECHGIAKCIRCGGDHKSSDTKCPKVKDYRAALTRTLLSTRNQVQANQPVKNNPAFTISNFPRLDHLSPANTLTANDNHVDTIGMFEKLRETMIEEGKKTRESFDQLKEEMSQRNNAYEQELSNLKSQVAMLDNQLAQHDLVQQETMILITSIIQVIKSGMKKKGEDIEAFSCMMDELMSKYHINSRDLKFCNTKS